MLRVALGAGGTCLGARSVLSIVDSVIDVSHCAFYIDRLTVGGVLFCVLGVDCSTGDAHFDCGAGVTRSIEIPLGIPSSSIAIACDVMMIIRNGLTSFGKTSDRGTSVIRWAGFFPVRV